ncbi:MAG TPA: 16S rRNA (adenine(1518)-N(6)/adenine(1519)-N(6))-dimethyltransferase RsmA [Candidatus Limnocylindria bacterium]|nr:16S rRNA (adenine(1518)-N(6)/adenine(1519)-N(6))-dimethyltransferase RsmA [Candidatus Limnocylindria bacterium]
MPKPPRTPRPRASSYVRERAAAEGSEVSRVKQALALRGLAPRKRFGQNFLIREELAERIVEHCHLQPDDVAVEIGPGAGALTLRIARRVRHLVAVELDTGLAELLREEVAEFPRVEVVEGDIREFDLAHVAAAHGASKVVVVGNIPYNITTPILERLFEQRAAVKSAVLLVQKEYAERLAAAAGTPEYGSLTLFARYYALLEPLMTVRASGFWPRPLVDSMLVRFLLREQPPVEVPDEALLFRLIRGSFHMRRKQLINTLEETLGIGKARIQRLARWAGIDASRRGETLTLEEFAKLAKAAAAAESSASGGPAS